MALIAEAAFIVFSIAFLSGLLITAFTGSAKYIKHYLVVLTAISIIVLLIGVIFSRGLLIFLIFQIITLVILIFFAIIAGAAAGGGIYQLIHKHSAFKKLKEDELNEYLLLADFLAIEDLTEERVIARAKSLYYQGGKYKGDIYIHKSELSSKEENENQQKIQTMKEFQSKK